MLGVRKSNIKASTIYLISMDLAKQYSYSFLPFTNQDGTHSILTKKIGLLSKKLVSKFTLKIQEGKTTSKRDKNNN